MRTIIAFAAAAIIVTLTGCSAPEPAASPTPSPSATSTWHAPAATADNSLQWDEHIAAVDAGTAAMAAFLDHSLPADQWWEVFAVYLTSDAKYVWQGTDPRNIPATKITGAVSVLGEPTATRVQLSVPTDAGVYEVTVVRHVAEGSEPGPWQIFTLTPPTSTKNVAIGAGERPPIGESTFVSIGGSGSLHVRGVNQ